MQGILYLVPAPLGEGRIESALPADVVAVVRSLKHFIGENPKTTRRHLRAIGIDSPIAEIDIQILDEHTPPGALPALLAPLLEGHDAGLMSEAGCPAIADPGAALVELAHRQAIRVRPLVGPCSLLLALMASGLNGQRFAFHGYLPADRAARRTAIVALQLASYQRDETEIFIETPYRNDVLLADLLTYLDESTRVCVAADVTLGTESVMTRSVAEWRRTSATIGKRPAVFLISAAARIVRRSRTR